MNIAMTWKEPDSHAARRRGSATYLEEETKNCQTIRVGQGCCQVRVLCIVRHNVELKKYTETIIVFC